MRQRILRRLEALEKAHRSREQRELSSLQTALVYIWKIVLAYYLGGLESDEELLGLELDEERLGEAFARALKYESRDEYLEVLYRKRGLGLDRRSNDAYRRLFANVGLDFDRASSRKLFDAFVTMVNRLPDKWLNWLRSELEQWCKDAKIAHGSNLPHRLSHDNFLLY
jgi:hypothetical protein